MPDVKSLCVPGEKPILIIKWLVKEGDWLNSGTPMATYKTIEDDDDESKAKKVQLKSKHVGTLKSLLISEGEIAKPGKLLLEMEDCSHPVVMKDMCAECGQDLRILKETNSSAGKHKVISASVSMIPNIPELRISSQQAEEIAQQDKDRLHQMKKLVLLVDLDQTLIHTTQDAAIAELCRSEEDFYTFQLNRTDPTLYTKLRPHCREFLQKISQCYELQIVTFGSRQYAHKIADLIDPEKKFFAHRILSRNECIHPFKKSGNLRHLFPCGDSMVCIIDDRHDVWNGVPNLVIVKKYSYFQGTGDVNNPFPVQKPTPPTQNIAEKPTVEKVEDNAIKKPQSSRKRKSEDDPLEGEDDRSKIKCSIQNETEETPKINVDDDLSISSDSDSRMSSSSSGSSSSSSSSNSSDTCLNQKSDNHDSSNPNQTTETVDSCSQQNSFELKNVKNGADGKSKTANTEISLDDSSTSNSSSICNKPSDLVREPSSGLSQDTAGFTQSEDLCKNEIKDTDDYLPYLQDILLQTHSTYYGAYEKYLKKEFQFLPDIRGIVPFLRSKVLYGCCLVLTGLIPNYYTWPPVQHRIFMVAKQLGAEIEEQISDKTTHLIAARRGTSKYQEAKQGNMKTIKLVSVEWLWCCSERWEKVPEQLFPVPVNAPPCSSREGTPKDDRITNTTENSKLPETLVGDSITGKIIKEAKDPRLYFMVDEACKRREKGKRKLPNVVYSSLKVPDKIVPVTVMDSGRQQYGNNITKNGKSNEKRGEFCTRENSAASRRTRKKSMVEEVGIGYSLSSDDIADMDKEVDDVLESSDDDTNDSFLFSSQRKRTVPQPSKANDDAESSSEEEFEEMAALLNAEMHYEESPDKDLESVE